MLTELYSLVENFQNWLIIPMKRRNSEMLVGGFILTIAYVLAELELIPFPSMMCPRSLMDDFPN